MRSTAIVATIGRVCQRGSVLLEMARAGMDVARINFSHEDERVHSERLKLIRAMSRRSGISVRILFDLKGPEVRLWGLEQPLPLRKGDAVYLSASGGGKRLRRHRRIQLSNPVFLEKVQEGSRILIDDGYAELEVERKRSQEVRCLAVEDCILKPKKSVSSEFLPMGQKAVTAEDERAIRFGVQQHVDYLALSHVRTAADVEEARSLLGNSGVTLVAKIENFDAVKQIRAIMQASDGIMVARGDLGMNVPLVYVPLIQDHLLRLCRREGKVAMVATQMMESMMTNRRPTRAEVNDVYGAVKQGANALVLSGETAAGAFPSLAIEYMRRTIEVAETKSVEDIRAMERVASGQ